MKNFAIAFQIGAAFSGNKAFTSAAAKLAEINAKVKSYKKSLDALNNSNTARIMSQNQLSAAIERTSNAYDNALVKQKRYKNLVKAQGNFEGSYTNMTKYGINTMQFFEAGKFIYSFADAASSFEAAMSKVKAITKGSNEEMELLKKQAIDLGKKTRFSASESAAAMSYLGMAGWKTNQIMSAMPGLLDLAAASGEDLATVADIISDDLTAFGLQADKAAHMADVFAATSSNANTNVAMMGQTFKYAGSVAGSLGYKLEDVALATGLMANGSIKADQAGTSLRSIMTRLVKPPKEAANALSALGITAVESDGKMKPFAAVLLEMREKFKGLSEAEKGQYGAMLAGQEALSGFLTLMNASDADVEKLSSAIANCDDSAKAMADTMTSNANGKVIAFKSAMESLQISIGNNLLPTISNAVVYATELADSFGKFTAENPGLVNGMMTAITAMLTLGAASNALMWLVNGLKSCYYGLIAAQNFLTTSINVNVAAEKAWQIAKLIGITLMQTGNNLWQLATGKITLMTAKQNILTVAQWAYNSALLACPTMWLVAGLAAVVAAGYLLYKNWDTVTKFGSQAWEWFCNNVVYGVGYMIGWFATIPERVTSYFNNLDVVGESFGEKAWNWGKLAVDNIVSWFLNMPDRIGNIISSMWNRIKLGFNAGMVTAESEVQVAHNASGGIYGKGAFLTTFAEDSGESAIPHTPNARNIGLLAETNRIMGNPLGGGANITATFAPNITIQGGGDEGKIREVLELEMAKFKKMLQDLQNQQRRVSYA